MKFNCPTCNQKLEFSFKKYHVVYLSVIVVLLFCLLSSLMLNKNSIENSKSKDITHTKGWPTEKQVFNGFEYKNYPSCYYAIIDSGVTAKYSKQSNWIEININTSKFIGVAGIDKLLDNIFPGNNDARIALIGKPITELNKSKKYISSKDINYKNFNVLCELDRRTREHIWNLYIRPDYNHQKK